ncbi:MAG: transketolase [Selenomonas ruminantium]|uniref:Transketolase n=1 Tax=Selenomonas ruminantium TaxID=971 RepID=A0A927WHG2_SELRU|nr:transketolase [Selenomonas ruminantium]MBE6084545.1 transketolase [Selenomonas ruminantium]
MAEKKDSKTILKDLRKQIFLIGYRGGMAHLASCFSCLEILYALYAGGVLKIDTTNPAWEERDRFILSKGHAGLALYAMLVHKDLMTEVEFASYLQEGGIIGGEPCLRDSKWIEATTGSLGHGLSFAVGIAMALKLKGSSAKVYVLLGDGEIQEGTVWEAAMSAAALKLDNLVAILDCNEIQKMDFVDKTIGVPRWQEKWDAFGWQVDAVDGHNVEALQVCLSEVNEKDKPRFVIAHTIKGKGVSVMEQNPNWHFKLPKSKKEKAAFTQDLGITEAEWEV